jgi:branched-chain amino acid transport system permease protein
MWEQQIVNGLTSGVVYALMAMGFSLVWSTARTMNFAYGVTYALGAYAFFVIVRAGLSGEWGLVAVLAVAFVGVAGAGAVFGYLMDRAVFRPLRDNELAPFFASLGVAIALENVFGFLFGTRPLIVNIEGIREFFRIGPVTITLVQIVVIASSVLIMIALHVLLSRTRTGRAMRATSFDRRTARLMGIDVNRTIAIVFILAGVLAASAGAFVGMFYGVAQPYMGSAVLVKGLAAAVLGGFGSIPGAIVGGLLIGVMEAVGAGVTTSGNWQDVVAYVVLIGVILVRPQGIFGEPGLQAR